MTILTQQLVLVRQKVVQCVSIERKVYRIHNVKEVGQPRQAQDTKVWI